MPLDYIKIRKLSCKGQRQKECQSLGIAKGQDVTIMTMACYEFIQEKPKNSFCSRRFMADVVCQDLPLDLKKGDVLSLAKLPFLVTGQKHCHPNCTFDKASCPLHQEAFFLEALEEGSIFLSSPDGTEEESILLSLEE